MKAAKVLGLSGLFAMGLGQAASAGISLPPTYQTPSGGGVFSRLKTVFSVGLQWDFGDQKPQVVGSVRRTRTSPSNEVLGGKLDVAIPLMPESFTSPTFRILGLAGDRTFQGEGGFGFSLSGGKINPLLAVGAQGPYTNAGVNFVIGDKLHPYFGFNTIRRAPDPRSGGALSCNSPFLLTNTPLNPGAAAPYLVGGYTCQTVPPPPPPP